jgi:arginine/lysine/ornithine decarboxylase
MLQNRHDLYDRLLEYTSDGYVPMHMPGHKRNPDIVAGAMGIDITEITGFDNLHNPQGILRQSQEQAAKWYGAARSWFLVNGSSIGLMAGIMAAVPRHGRVCVARNCHVSVYNAICENELEPVYIYPEFVENLGISLGITATMVEKTLAVDNVNGVDDIGREHIKAVVITSPTYEGNVSDIGGIAEVCHRHGAYLVVDEAHGAHFGYDSHFPETAIRQGADIVVQSLHKTLPSLTQTAILHLGRDARDGKVLAERLDRYVGWFQSTSPSYVLMASIDRCLGFVNSADGRVAFAKYAKELVRLRDRLCELKSIACAPSDDMSKILLCGKNGHLQGKTLYDILEKRYKIQLEMAGGSYCIAMTSVADRPEYYGRFLAALEELDKTPWEYMDGECTAVGVTSGLGKGVMPSVAKETRMRPCEALDADYENVPLEGAAGRVSRGFVTVYPPGIPNVCPGEVFDDTVIGFIGDSIRQGLDVIGVKDGNVACLR